jgi:tripartite-type tricarboxylate transporter receptor subunit TctC
MSSIFYRASGVAAASLAIAHAHAQSAMTGSAGAYPAKPVRIVVGFVPGGGSDFIARLVAQKITEPLGRSVLIDNRPGAGGVIATEYVARQAADGYTLLLTSAGPNGIVPAMSAKITYDPLKDFDAITQVVNMPFMMAVHPSLPAKNVKELITLARARPGQLNYGSAGHGSTNHLVGEILKLYANIQLTHVPYKGVAAAMTDAIAGQIQIMSGDLVTIWPQAKTGKLRALAVTSAKRSTLTPTIPTIAESGVPGFDTSGWFGVVAPAGTPRAINERLHSEIVKGITAADARERLSAMGGDVVASSSADFAAFMRADHAKWAKVVVAAGLRESP